MNGGGRLDKSGLSPLYAPMNEIVARLFRPEDFVACLAIFDSNVPKFFAAQERAEFIHHLQNMTVVDYPYIVLTRGGKIVACGGLTLDRASRQAGLAWGMVDRPLHGQGLGTELTQIRLDFARGLSGFDRLILETSQHTQGFYEGFGFIVLEIVPDGFAAGLDRVEMALRLA
jgi:RimJ/RimL family protein N-acetyltransferase